MLLHHSIKFAGTHLYSWRGTARILSLAQENNTDNVLSQGSNLDSPESSALAMRALPPTRGEA